MSIDHENRIAALERAVAEVQRQLGVIIVAATIAADPDISMVSHRTRQRKRPLPELPPGTKRGRFGRPVPIEPEAASG